MSVAQHVFRLPDLGEGLTEAEVVTWHVAVGDIVGIDQEVVTVETAKASVDVPCPYAGRVTALHAEPGVLLPVGEPLITVGEGGGEEEGDEGGEPRRGAGGDAGVGAAAAAAAEQYRTEERAGTDPDQPERPLIGYGAADGPARRPRSRRTRPASATPPRSNAPTPPPTPTPPSASNGGSPTPPSASNGGSPTPPDARNGSSAQAVRVISPLVRTLAQSWGVDLATVRPGPTGVIRKADLEAARSRQPHGAAGGVEDQPHGAVGVQGAGAVRAAGETRIPIQGVHRLMAERLSTSRREIPDATTWVDVDATKLVRARAALHRTRPEAGIGTLALLARITVAGLTAYPALNSSVDLAAGEIVQHGRVNLGFAAQSPRGLVVPVVHDAHTLSTAELAERLRELTGRAREGRLSPAELTGGTFTLNNYGVFGVDGSTPIINHPEAAMLGVGRIADKPWVHKGRLRVRKVTQLSLTFDHRVCDGATAGGFLRLVADCVEDPATLLADV